jgi:hypothetical protein
MEFLLLFFFNLISISSVLSIYDDYLQIAYDYTLTQVLFLLNLAPPPFIA